MTVGYIIAEPPTKKGNKTEAVDTATPLAQSLGLTIDTSWCVPPSRLLTHKGQTLMKSMQWTRRQGLRRRRAQRVRSLPPDGMRIP